MRFFCTLSFVLVLVSWYFSACREVKTQEIVGEHFPKEIICISLGCHGTYYGPEYINGSDVAHQFSNKMSSAVGDKLKQLYASQVYVKVDFAKVNMTTVGMGTGTVSYSLSIPFDQVNEKCEAFTSFDHVGGWNHTPALEQRKMQLQSLLLKGDQLYISDLEVTAEGLQEYWIQWRNEEVQWDCLEDVDNMSE